MENWETEPSEWQKIKEGATYIGRGKMSWRGFCIVIIACFVVAGILFFHEYSHGQKFDFEGFIGTIFGLPLAIFLIFFLIARSDVFVIKNGKILYKGRQISMSGITKITALLETGQGRRPALCFYDDDFFRQKSFKVYIGCFGPKDLSVLLKSVLKESPQAEIDEVSKRLKEGNFKDIYSLAVKIVERQL